MTENVVLKVVKAICGRGHHLYTDNVYTSPSFFLQLRFRGFHACGTLRLNRRGVPPEARVKLKKGEQQVVPLDDTMKVVQWHGKRVVSILSTIHSDAIVPIERQSRHAKVGCKVVEKPESITEYNKYMGGVDHADQLLSYYGFPHRMVKWWRRVFFYLFNAALVNSYIMYSQTINRRHLSHEQFHMTLAKELLQAVSVNVLPSQPPHGPRHQACQPLACLTE